MNEATMNQPKISVILAVRNMQSHIGSAIRSVIDQDYPNTELIVMDGGSTDGTVEIIKQYASHITYWQSQPDNGPANAANIAIDIATGDLIGFLNADDVLQPGLYTKMAEIYNTNPNASVISCGIRIETSDADGKRSLIKDFSTADKLQLTVANLLHELTAFNGRYYRREIFNQYGKFQPFDKNGEWNLSNDREFLLRLALNNVQSAIIAEPLYTYLSHPGSFSFNFKNLPRILREHIVLGEQLLQQPLSKQNQKLVSRWIARESANLCLISLAFLDFASAKYAVKSGMSQNPYTWPIHLLARSFSIGTKKLAALLFP